MTDIREYLLTNGLIRPRGDYVRVSRLRWFGTGLRLDAAGQAAAQREIASPRPNAPTENHWVERLGVEAERLRRRRAA